MFVCKYESGEGRKEGRKEGRQAGREGRKEGRIVYTPYSNRYVCVYMYVCVSALVELFCNETLNTTQTS